MAGVPARCTNPRCDYVFVSDVISIEFSSMISLSGNTTRCPRCGGLARFVDGVFDERGRGRLELVAGPPETREIFERLYGVALRVQSGEISHQEAIQQAKAIEPRLGSIIERFLLMGLPIFALLVGLIQIYLQYQSNLSTAEFEREALELLKRQASAMEQLVNSSDSPSQMNHRLVPGTGTLTPAHPEQKPTPPEDAHLSERRNAPKVAVPSKVSKRRRRRLRGMNRRNG